MTRPKILLYLHHVELGQRYPISEDVIIGRMSGHILFPKDERLSDQHCRIYRGERDGLFIRDLGSEHGTVVDGRLLSPEKSYQIRDGTTIAVGQQVFKCVEPRQRTVRKKNKREKPSADFTWIFVLLIAVALGAALTQYQKQLVQPLIPKARQIAGLAMRYVRAQAPEQPDLNPPPVASPFEIVYKEIESAYGNYTDLGKSVQEGKTDPKGMASTLRGDLIPKFQGAQAKLGVLKPASEFERRRIEVNTRLVTAILKQITAMASFAETKNQKYQDEVDKLTPEVAAANEEARKVNNAPRVPAAEN